MTFSTYQYDHEYRCGQYDRYIEEKYQSNYCVPKSVKGHKSVPKNVKGENSVPNFSIKRFAQHFTIIFFSKQRQKTEFLHMKTLHLHSQFLAYIHEIHEH